jgi:hypothetical protein
MANNSWSFPWLTETKKIVSVILCSGYGNRDWQFSSMGFWQSHVTFTATQRLEYVHHPVSLKNANYTRKGREASGK